MLMADQPDAGFPFDPSSRRAGITRRDILRGLAAGGAALASVPIVAPYGAPHTVEAAPARWMGQAVDVTLITAQDLPYPGLPSADVQAADPGMKAYAEAVQPWFDENPGVKLEQI